MPNLPERSEIEDLLHCMICFETYQNPKMLNCGHTFCSECLVGYLQTYQQQRRAVPGKLPCPTCRELTAIPSSGVNGLKNDFKVRKIEEMFKTVNLREHRASQKFCDSCKTQQKSIVAKFYCTNCSMNYCDSCSTRHDKNPIFKDHRVIDKTSDSSNEAFCSVHKGEQVKYFCKVCETVICTLCIINQHEGHEVMEIQNMFRRHQQDINNLQKTIEAKLKTLREKGLELERLRSLNLKSSMQAEAKIKDTAKEIIMSVQQQEEEILMELRDKRDIKLKRLMKELDSVNFYVAKACSLQDFASHTVRRKSIRLMAIHEELIQRMRTVAEIDTIDTSDIQQEVQSMFTFLPGRHDNIKLGRLEELQGTADDLKNHVAVSVPPPSPQRLNSTGSSRSQNYGQAKLLFAIKKHGKDIGELRDPLGVASLLNGDIVVTEWGNKRLQIFDTVGKPVGTIGKGVIGPQGVTITLKGNIMITDAQNKRVEIFTITGNSLTRWGLGKFFGPCGIAVCPNGNIIVTDIAEHTVSIYQNEKKCIKRFGGRGTGNNQFINPLYVTSNVNSEIIVSDSDNHCVKMFDTAGNFLRKIGSEGDREGQLKFPRGVTTDENGNIVVADRNNDRVCLFTPTGGFLRHLLTREDGVRDPYGVAVSSARNLIITESGSNRASLKLFQL